MLFLLMMDIAKSETFENFTILNRALLFLVTLNKTAVQSLGGGSIILLHDDQVIMNILKEQWGLILNDWLPHKTQLFFFCFLF